MRTTRDDLRELRDRAARLERAIGAFTPSAPHSCRRYVGKVVGTVSGAPPIYVETNPVAISGPMTTGTAATLTPDPTQTVPVLVFGQLPAVGQALVARNYRGRWECHIGTGGTGTGGGTTVVIPDCFCDPVPSPITVTATSVIAGACPPIFNSCSLTYGPTPPGYVGLDLGTSCFLSDDSFPDPIAGGAMFRYLLTCQGNQFNLSRVYLESPYGSPYRDAILYSWLVGAAPNTCSPFSMQTGSAFAGAGCVVTLAG